MNRRTWEAAADVVVVGGGVAGLTAALEAHQRGLSVLVLSKAGPGQTATTLAQGGVAVVDADARAAGDSVQSHLADTLAAGAGLCDETVVASILGAADGAVGRLRARGAQFDRLADGSLARTREGGHSFNRIIHAGGDATGAEIQRALEDRAAGIDLRFGHSVTALSTGPLGVTGVSVLGPDGSLGLVHATAVVLATGGLGQLYASTTNPAQSTGDGIALALRAGATVADLEFVQFHPTMLFQEGSSGTRPLVSEAVRGEGARLVDIHGGSVTAGVHPLGDLAPRDVVARAIFTRMQRTGAPHVYLDARSIPGFARRFPTIDASCKAEGIDPAADLIPVAPAAHYSCGGVVTDLFGGTGVPGLFAVGELARTGLHGANRLASNSLLEAAVMGERVAAVAAQRVAEAPRGEAEPEHAGHPTADRHHLQALMTRHASVVRDGAGLTQALGALDRTAALAASDDATAVEDAALLLTARAVVTAAIARTESRGCHTRADYPETDDTQRRSMELRLTGETLDVKETARV